MQTITQEPPATTQKALELGIYSFVENTPDPSTNTKISPENRLKNLLEEIELADQVGLDAFGIGEHHREEYIASSPAVILAAAAARTKNIKLGSAVTVLSSDDPVRVFQDFATLDLISSGRAEIVAGRGSFIADTTQQALDESFPSVAAVMNKLGRERGWSPMSKNQYEASSHLRGHLAVGNPEAVAEKIIYQQQNLGHDRFMLQLSVGTLPHKQLMHTIELYGTKVAPVVRAEISRGVRA